MLNKLNPKYYFSGAIVLGFCQTLDGIAGLNGYHSSLATAFSILELLWFLVSLVFALAFQQLRLPLVVPLLYISYFAFAWLCGSYLYAQATDIVPFQLPTWFMLLATTFGLVYCFTAYRFYKKLYH